MSNAAKDSAGKMVYADTIGLSRKNELFFCPNESCNAPMRLISPSVKEHRMTSSHFANRDSKYKHIKCCFYSSSLLANAMKYDISIFDIKALFQTVVNRSPLKTDNSSGAAAISSGEPRALELRSVANTYYRFLTSDLEREINGKRIGDMFACTRNHDKYKFLAKGYVLMELKYKNCYWGTRGEDNHLSMYCIFPRTKGEDDSPKIRWQLSFTDPNVLDEVEYQVHKTLHSAYCKKYTEAKNAGKEVIIAVLGNWEGRKCRIYSAKQISIVKPETRNNI